VKKPKLGNGFKNFSQLEALQAIIRTSVYILHHPKNPTNHWQMGFFTASHHKSAARKIQNRPKVGAPCRHETEGWAQPKRQSSIIVSAAVIH
jgi:hypothetical protein